MAWIEVHQSLPTHRKTLTAAELLGVEPAQVVGHVVSLWLWALDSAPGGELAGISERVLAQGAQWTGEPATFLQALTTAGFLDADEGLTIHDWWDYAGKLIDQRRANAARQKRFRDRHNASVTVTSRESNGAQYSTVPNPTVPHVNSKTVDPHVGASAPTSEKSNGRVSDTPRCERAVAESPTKSHKLPTPEASTKSHRAPAHGEQFAALVAGLGYEAEVIKTSPTMRGCLNKAAKELDESGYDADDIVYVCEQLKVRFKGVPFSAAAVAKWAPTFPRGPTDAD